MPRSDFPKSTAHGWLLILKKAHVLDKVLSGFLQKGIAKGKIDLTQIAIDDSFPPRAGGGQEVEYCHKGKGSLLHLVVDGDHFGSQQPQQKAMKKEQALRLLDQDPHSKYQNDDIEIESQ